MHLTSISRSALIGLLFLLIIFTLQRMAFDILGKMWLLFSLSTIKLIPINIVLHGVIMQKIWPFLLFLPWCVFWIFWNTLLILVYMNVFDLYVLYPALSLNLPESNSWWYSHGWDCHRSLVNGLRSSTDFREPLVIDHSTFPQTTVSNNTFVPIHKINPIGKSLSLSDTSQPASSWRLFGNQLSGPCWPDFRLIESIQCGIHILLSIFAFIMCTYQVIQLKRFRKYTLHHGFTFVQMPRSFSPFKAASTTATLTLSTTRGDVSRPLLVSTNGDVPGAANRSIESQACSCVTRSHGETASVTAPGDGCQFRSPAPLFVSSRGQLSAQTTLARRPTGQTKELAGSNATSASLTRETHHLLPSQIWELEKQFRAVRPNRASKSLDIQEDGTHKSSASVAFQSLSSEHCLLEFKPGCSQSQLRGRLPDYLGGRKPSSTPASAHSQEATWGCSQLSQLQEYSRRIAIITERRLGTASARSRLGSTSLTSGQSSFEVCSGRTLPQTGGTSSGSLDGLDHGDQLMDFELALNSVPHLAVKPSERLHCRQRTVQAPQPRPKNILHHQGLIEELPLYFPKFAREAEASPLNQHRGVTKHLDILRTTVRPLIP